MENVNCDFCGSSESEVAVAQKDIVHLCAPEDQTFYLHRCRQCGMIYLNPRPTPEQGDFARVMRQHCRTCRIFHIDTMLNSYYA